MSRTVKKVHVLPHDSGGWQVKKDNAKQASRAYTDSGDPLDKDRAKDIGRRIAKNTPGDTELVLHTTDGSFHKKHTYGYDPPETDG